MDLKPDVPTAPSRDPSYDLEPDPEDKKPEEAKTFDPDVAEDCTPCDGDDGDVEDAAAAVAASGASATAGAKVGKKKKKLKMGGKKAPKGDERMKDPFGPGDDPAPNQVQMQQEAIEYELGDISNDLDEALEKLEGLEGKK